MSGLTMFERIIKAMPRTELESLAKGYGNARPWQAERKELEVLLLSKDSEELRSELADIVRSKLLP
jgi:hypothetical protein